MNELDDTWKDKAIERTMQARTAMWTFTGTTQGVVITASSIVSALTSAGARWLVIPILIVGFIGVASLLRCFYLIWSERVDAPDDQARYKSSRPQEKLAMLAVLKTPHSAINRNQKRAFWCLGISSALFLLLAVIGAYGQWKASHPKSETQTLGLLMTPNQCTPVNAGCTLLRRLGDPLVQTSKR